MALVSRDEIPVERSISADGSGAPYSDGLIVLQETNGSFGVDLPVDRDQRGGERQTTLDLDLTQEGRGMGAGSVGALECGRVRKVRRTRG